MAACYVASGSVLIASNLDEIVMWMWLFATAHANQEHGQIVVGLFLGFAVLVLATLVGCPMAVPSACCPVT